MPVLLMFLAIVTGGVSSPAPAAAQAGVMPIYALSPTNGSTLTLAPSDGSTRVVFQSEPSSYFDLVSGITIEVSASNALGRDGTLSDDFNVDYNFVSPSDSAAQDLYVTSLRHFHFYKFDYDSQQYISKYPPGVYYFQFSAYTYGTHQHLISPVFSFVWNPTGATTTPPPAAGPTTSSDLTMSAHEARDHLRYMVRHKAHHRATHLRSHCTRVDASSFSCRPHFRAGKRSYRGHFVVHNELGSDGTTIYWSGYFLGHRRGGRAVRWVI